MKDIPVFSTQLGVASLTLNQIPYTAKAYIRIQSSIEPEAFLKECMDFCRACGAEEVYATGDPACAAYPEHTAIVKMQADPEVVGKTDAYLFPVTENTLSHWVELYNQKIVKVPNGAWMDRKAAQKLLSDGTGYFVHRDGVLLGTGIVCGQELRWVAAFQKGAGAEVVRALCSAVTEKTVVLEVATANKKAVDLYERLGFVACQELSRWYQVLSRKKA